MNKEVSLYKALIVIILFAILEAFFLFYFKYQELNKAKVMCPDAVCNTTKTICYVYEVDINGNTTVLWRGSCNSK